MDKEREKEQPEKSKEKWEMGKGDQNLRGSVSRRRMQLLCSAPLRRWRMRWGLQKRALDSTVYTWWLGQRFTWIDCDATVRWRGKKWKRAGNSSEKFGCAEELRNGAKTGREQNQEVLNFVLFIRWEIDPCQHLKHTRLTSSSPSSKVRHSQFSGDANLGWFSAAVWEQIE